MLLKKIQDKYGNTIYKRDNRKCNYYITTEEIIDDVVVPNIEDNRESITNKANAYQIGTFTIVLLFLS